MGAMVGFALGYVLGTRAGQEGFEELRASWKTISSSEEVRILVTGGMATMVDLARRGSELLSDRLQPASEQQLGKVA